MMGAEFNTVSSQKHQTCAGLAVSNSLSALRSTIDFGLWTYVLNFRARLKGDEIVEPYRGGRRPS